MKLQILVPQYKETDEVVKPLLDSIAIQQNVPMDEIGVIIFQRHDEVRAVPVARNRERRPCARMQSVSAGPALYAGGHSRELRFGLCDGVYYRQGGKKFTITNILRAYCYWSEAN